MFNFRIHTNHPTHFSNLHIKNKQPMSKKCCSERLELGLLGSDEKYQVAVRTLKTSDQIRVKKHGLNLFERFRFVELRLGQNVMLVNINSLRKRIPGLSKLSKDEIRAFAKGGKWIHSLKARLLNDLLSPTETHYEKLKTFIDELIPRKGLHLDKVTEGVKFLRNFYSTIEPTDATTLSIANEAMAQAMTSLDRDWKRIFNSLMQLFRPESEENQDLASPKLKEQNIIIDFARKKGVSGNTMLLILKLARHSGEWTQIGKKQIPEKVFLTEQKLETAFELLGELELEKHGIKRLEIETMIDFITKNLKDWVNKAVRTNAPVRIERKKYQDFTPRTLQINPDGTLYILFNRHSSKNDTLVGEGTYKSVKEGMKLTSGKKVALAVTTYLKGNIEEATKKEFGINLLLNASGPGLFPKPYEHSYTQYVASKRKDKRNKFHLKKISFMQQLLEGSTLETLVNKKIQLTEEETLRMGHNILAGLVNMHDNELLHKDIKVNNIFLSRDKKAYLADFGYAVALNDERKEAKSGTPIYMSPEYYWSRRAGFKTESPFQKPHDVWAAGISLYELLLKKDHSEIILAFLTMFYERAKESKLEAKYFTGEFNPAYFENNVVEVYETFYNDIVPSIEGPWLEQSDSPLFPIVEKMLVFEPTQRITAREALAELEAIIKSKSYLV